MGMGNVYMESGNGSQLGYEMLANGACCCVVHDSFRYLAIYHGNMGMFFT